MLQKNTSTFVRVEKRVRDMVKKHIKKTRQSIGGFYDLAAEEKLKRETTKS